MLGSWMQKFIARKEVQELSAREFYDLCTAPDFFKETETARKILALARICFLGTDACWDFLMEYDIRGVGYGTGDPVLPDILPTQWLASLGIDLAQNQWGIFDPDYARKFEEERLRRYSGGERHWMVGKCVSDSGADIRNWDQLVWRWQNEFSAHYNR